MTTPHRTRLWRALVAGPLACALLASTGCDLMPEASSQGAAAWAKTCPKGQQVAAELRADVSGSYGITKTTPDFKQALSDLTARVAMCGGHLRVVAFSGSNAGTAVLFDETVSVKGATSAAKARHVPAAVEQVITTVDAKLPVNTAGLAGGSAIASQLEGGKQYVEQLGNGYQLDEVILTDGLDNKAMPTAEIVDAKTATGAAGRVDVPELPGASVTFAGLGEVAGKPVDSAIANSLVTFYAALCKRTGADHCVAVSDYISPVGG